MYHEKTKLKVILAKVSTCIRTLILRCAVAIAAVIQQLIGDERSKMVLWSFGNFYPRNKPWMLRPWMDWNISRVIEVG